METRFFLFQHKRIQYKLYGQGKPVILIHGFGEDSKVWEPQIKFLEPYYRLIVPDIPGSGGSEIVPGANIETYADIIKALCDIEANDEPVHITGHSMGGYITLALAEKFPGLLNSFTLFHSSAFADNEEKKQTRKKAIDFIQEKGAYTFLKTSTPNLFTEQYRSQYPEKVEALIEDGKNFSEAALIQYYEAMIARPDRTDVLKTFSKPVVFIIGEHDQAIPFEVSLKQCHLPIQSHVHILRNSAHMGMWEETEKANDILLSFLQTL